jgi:spore coat polysaccharide biosynthesis protein SpsF
MGKTIGIIQARMGSDRLPGKILAPLGGRPLIAQLWSRIAHSHVDEWWLATSSHPGDDVTEAWGFELGLRVFRGDEQDVLSRFLAIGREAEAEWVLRVTADNPFLDAPVIDALIDARATKGKEVAHADLVRHRGGLALEPRKADSDPDSDEASDTSSVERTSPRLPVGYGVELARLESLERASRTIPKEEKHHRVHVTSWLSAEGNVVEVPTPSEWPDRGDWRWTVDTYEDLAMARSAFRVFGREASTIDYPMMVARLDAHPEIPAMNQHICQKALEAG